MANKTNHVAIRLKLLVKAIGVYGVKNRVWIGTVIDSFGRLDSPTFNEESFWAMLHASFQAMVETQGNGGLESDVQTSSIFTNSR